jgi:predicted phosphohydrolase
MDSFTIPGVYRAPNGLWISNVSLNGVKYRGASAPTQKKAIETLFELRKKVYLREIDRLQNIQKPTVLIYWLLLLVTIHQQLIDFYRH